MTEKSETGQEQRQMSRDEMIDVISRQMYKPVYGFNRVLFLNYEEHVVGELPNDSAKIIIRYGSSIIPNDPHLSRENLLAQNTFYHTCCNIGISPKETYMWGGEELEVLHEIFSRLMENKEK